MPSPTDLLSTLGLLFAQAPVVVPEASSEVPGVDVVAMAAIDTELGGFALRREGWAGAEHAEVTSLADGRTVAVMVRPATGGGTALSPAAASAIGIASGDAVRIRPTVLSAPDRAALAGGLGASPRLAAPPVLLAALRRRAIAPVEPVPPPERSRAAAARHVVQVATFASRAGAVATASAVDGRVEPTGAYYRVRIGPFADRDTAERARANAVKHGYRDAQILIQ